MKFLQTSSKGAAAYLTAGTVLKIVFAYALLTAASKISVQIGPVPLTLQTCAVCFIGAFLGARAGFAAVAVWVLSGFAGMPVFATPMQGLAALFGPTAGYLVSFPLAAAFCGWLASKGWTGKKAVKSFVNQYAGNLLVVLFGAVWFSAAAGMEQALMSGFVPFIIPAMIKAALGASVLYAFALYRR